MKCGQATRHASLVVLGGLGAFVLLSIGATFAIRYPIRRLSRTEVFALQNQPTTVRLPFVCQMNRKQEIFKQTFEGTGTIIVVESNCRLKIRDCTLKGDVVVLAKNLAHVEIIGSTLEGNDVAIRSERVASLHVTGRSVLKGKSAAADLGSIANLELADSRAEGGEVGIHAENHVNLWLRRSTVTGHRYAVEAGHDLKVETSKATLRGKRAAVWATTGLELDAQGGVFGGDSAVIEPEPNAKIQLSHNIKLEANSTGIEAGGNLRLTAESASIHSNGIAIRAGDDVQIDLLGKTRVHGGKIGLRLAGNASISMHDVVIESDGFGICAGKDAAISVQNSTIQAQVEGLRLWSQPRRFEGTALEGLGKTNFKALDCEP